MTCSFYNIRGDNFNIEAVCPYYEPEHQFGFTWQRDDDGIAIVSGYDPDLDERNWWLCECGNFETSGFHCSDCGREPPWGCDCGLHDEYYDPDYDYLEPDYYDSPQDDWEPEEDWDFTIGFYDD